MTNAFVHSGPGQSAFEQHVQPTIAARTDVIVGVARTTIRGAYPHILKGEGLIVPGNTTDAYDGKVELHLERRRDRDSAITTRLVDTTDAQMLLNALTWDKFDAELLIPHHFKLDQILDAYDTFAHAARTSALKVIIEA